MTNSFYDQFSNSEAPAQPKLEREVNWQANRDDTTKPYVNSEQPRHVKEAMEITRKDKSYYAFQPFAMGHKPRCEFEASVANEFNNRFGALQKGFDFITERERYIKLYREMM